MNYDAKIKITDYLNNDWKETLDSNVLEKLDQSIANEINKTVDSDFYPYKIDDVFKIFNECKYENISVVILGQDPYYSNKMQANGMAFSVGENVPLPPSLKNIYKECYKDAISRSGDLTHWVKQGVFLLNTSLTVRAGKPGSHISIWREFINLVINKIQLKGDVIFCLWGKHAQDMCKIKDCIILTCSHPSPLSAYKTDKPFIGSDIFEKINKELEKLGKQTIKW